jgi:hypothetical protein
MSGLGVEGNGCAGSHSICGGISALPEDRKTFHGERGGFFAPLFFFFCPRRITAASIFL